MQSVGFESRDSNLERGVIFLSKEIRSSQNRHSPRKSRFFVTSDRKEANDDGR